MNSRITPSRTPQYQNPIPSSAKETLRFDPLIVYPDIWNHKFTKNKVRSYSEQVADGVVDNCDEEGNQDGKKTRFIFF